MRLATTTLQVPPPGAQAAIELKNVGDTPARRVVVSVGGETGHAGDIAPGATGQAYLFVTPAQHAQKVVVSYRHDTEHVTIEAGIVIGEVPPKEQGPAVVITNPGGQRADWVELPAPVPHGAAVYDDGAALPVTNVGGPAVFVDLAAAQTKALAVRVGECAAETDIEVGGDAAGTVAIQNSHLRLVFDPRIGGTVSSFITRAGGGEGAIDYGAGSFGAEYRVGDQTVAQRSSPGTVRVIEQDRFGASVEVVWEDERVAVAQVWRLRAFDPFVALSVTITPKALPDDAAITFLNSHLKGYEGQLPFSDCATACTALMGDGRGQSPFSGCVTGRIALIGDCPHSKSVDPGAAKSCDIEVYAQPRGGPVTAQFLIYNSRGGWDRLEEFIAARELAPVALVVL